MSQQTKAHAIVNPAAANGRLIREWPRLLSLLIERLGDLSWEFTEFPEHATALARRALDQGVSHIFSVGGDGTHSQVANALLGPQGTLFPEAVLIPISRGTGGDLTRTLGLSRDPEKAVQTLDLDRVHTIDAGWVGFQDAQGRRQERAFLNVASLGIGGEVDLRVNRTTKAFGGFASFLWATLATLLTYRPKRVSFSLDGGPWREEVITLIAVANGQYFGGGMWVAPTCAMDDGRFSVVMAQEMGLAALLSPLFKLYKGTHLDHPKVHEFQAQSLAAQSSDEVWLDIDGEPLGTLPAEFRILPAALTVTVGPGYSGGRGT